MRQPKDDYDLRFLEGKCGRYCTGNAAFGSTAKLLIATRKATTRLREHLAQKLPPGTRVFYRQQDAYDEPIWIGKMYCAFGPLHEGIALEPDPLAPPCNNWGPTAGHLAGKVLVEWVNILGPVGPARSESMPKE